MVDKIGQQTQNPAPILPVDKSLCCVRLHNQENLHKSDMLISRYCWFCTFKKETVLLLSHCTFPAEGTLP